jgi:hypothetical protein
MAMFVPVKSTVTRKATEGEARGAIGAQSVPARHLAPAPFALPPAETQILQVLFCETIGNQRIYAGTPDALPEADVETQARERRS